MSDIVERLRKGIEWTGPTQDDTGQTENYMDEAADQITALRAENERLRAALELFACDCTAKHLCAQPDNCVNYIARAALSHQEQKGGE